MCQSYLCIGIFDTRKPAGGSLACQRSRGLIATPRQSFKGPQVGPFSFWGYTELDSCWSKKFDGASTTVAEHTYSTIERLDFLEPLDVCHWMVARTGHGGHLTEDRLFDTKKCALTDVNPQRIPCIKNNVIPDLLDGERSGR
jgi:hypothetical protein